MVKLRDYFESDLDTFINNDEFGTNVVIEKETISIVVDNDLLKEMQLANGGEGLENSEILFHARKINFNFVPHVGQDVLFNGELYYIDDIKEDEGVFTITIGVPRS